MSRWGFGRYTSPFSSSSNTNNPPVVTSDDYDYIVNDDINRGARGGQPPSNDRYEYDQSSRTERYTELENPDFLYIKHRNRMVTVEFPAYTIAEGLLQVGMIRSAAADRLGTNDIRRLKLQYKGKTLRDDKQTAQAAGLKQNSELTCVITEGEYGDSDSEEAYDPRRNPTRPTPTVREPGSRDGYHSSSNPATPSRTSFPTATAQPIATSIPIPTTDAATSSRASSIAPPQKLESYKPPPDSTPAREKIQHALDFYRTHYLPVCRAFLDNPPADPVKRKKEATRLGETVFGQILNRLDEIPTDGYEAVRAARKAAINEVKEVVGVLDEYKDGR